MIDEQAYGRRDIVVRSDRHNLADHHIARIHNSFSPPRAVGPTGMSMYMSGNPDFRRDYSAAIVTPIFRRPPRPRPICRA
jgi:hypothetical protein